MHVSRRPLETNWLQSRLKNILCFAPPMSSSGVAKNLPPAPNSLIRLTGSLDSCVAAAFKAASFSTLTGCTGNQVLSRRSDTLSLAISKRLTS
eukprot:1190477-Prorocentrum_minimum.AAC.5